MLLGRLMVNLDLIWSYTEAVGGVTLCEWIAYRIEQGLLGDLVSIRVTP